MIVKEIVELLDGEVLIGESYLDLRVKAAFGSDLMSDVLAFAETEAVLLTGLINNQVIRTAEMLDLRAIVFVRGKIPGKEVISLAEENRIVLISTDKTLYTTAGILYAHGLRGIADE
ncbi:MAG: hypothetical protein JXO44_00170 [Clostridia bacterium]|nr:hypothetical protein [Clostridia bacterium]